MGKLWTLIVTVSIWTSRNSTKSSIIWDKPCTTATSLIMTVRQSTRTRRLMSSTATMVSLPSRNLNSTSKAPETMVFLLSRKMNSTPKAPETTSIPTTTLMIVSENQTLFIGRDYYARENKRHEKKPRPTRRLYECDKLSFLLLRAIQVRQ